MIQFFRKIRQKLILDENAKKYLLYATGEILLVVIGILIALQIDNWNDARKDRSFEVKMLTEIKKALDGDIYDFQSLILRMEKLDSFTIDLANNIYQKSVNAVSIPDIKDLQLNTLYTGIQYQYNRGPYDAIRYSGIDKISNDSLRNNLIKFYDFTFPRNKEISQWADRSYDDQIERVKSFLGKTDIVLESGEISFTRAFNRDILEDQKFIDLIEEINSRAKRVRQSLKYMVPKMTDMRDQINSEIIRKN